MQDSPVLSSSFLSEDETQVRHESVTTATVTDEKSAVEMDSEERTSIHGMIEMTEETTTTIITELKMNQNEDRDTALSSSIRDRMMTTDPTQDCYIQERQPEIAQQKQLFRGIENARSCLLVALFVFLIISELLYLTSSQNSTTSTSYNKFEAIDMPYAAVYYPDYIVECTSVKAVDQYYNEYPIKIINDIKDFVYDDQVQEYVQIGLERSDQVYPSLGYLLLPPWKFQLKANEYFAVYTSCITHNQTHTIPLSEQRRMECCCNDNNCNNNNDTYGMNSEDESDGLNSNYQGSVEEEYLFHSNRTTKKAYWEDLLFLRTSDWLYLTTSVEHPSEILKKPSQDYGLCSAGLEGCVSNRLYEKLIEKRRNYQFTSIGGLVGTTLQQIEIKDYTKNPTEESIVYNQILTMDTPVTHLILYNESGWKPGVNGSNWALYTEHWLISDPSALKLTVETRQAVSVFDGLASVGGFLSIVNRGTRSLVTLIVIGVTINISWLGLRFTIGGLARNAPLDEDTERRINLLLERRRMVTENIMEERIKQLTMKMENDQRAFKEKLMKQFEMGQCGNDAGSERTVGIDHPSEDAQPSKDE